MKLYLSVNYYKLICYTSPRAGALCEVLTASTAEPNCLEKILADNSIDIAIISELNLTKNTPKIKIISNFAIFQTENATELVSFVRITFKDR